MLTDTDIHYLVGLLVLSSGEDNVDVMLGDMVDDVASGTPRDVDITVTARAADGTIQAFSGIEVKAEKRPLDVIAVEQLCAKLKDMPGITIRGAWCRRAGYHGASNREGAAPRDGALGTERMGEPIGRLLSRSLPQRDAPC